MNILYIHGFGSRYDPEHEKIKALETLGTVYGVDVDYCKGFAIVMETIRDAVMDHKIDLLVGTSMGGYSAAHVGAVCGIPFVALNPAVEPSQTLQKWVGCFVDYTGQEHMLSETVASSYPDIAETGCGLVIVESGDEVISATHTINKLDKIYNVHLMIGGSHRFTHIEEALPLIQTHYEMAQINYGN